jgi:cold shock CspA family protein
LTGNIKRIFTSRSYGFVESGGQSYFAHANDSPALLPFDARLAGLAVTFDVASTPKGPPAVNVRLV